MTEAARGAKAEVRRVRLDHAHLPYIDVRVRRNRRGRNIRIIVDECGVVTASVPQRLAIRRIDELVHARADWIHARLEEQRRVALGTVVDLEAGEPVRWLGQLVATRIERRDASRSSVRIEHDPRRGSTIVIRLASGADAHDVLVGWYRRQARDVFTERVADWASMLGLRHGSVTVREQRTRWGSCSHRGDLSFNWRLVLAPLWVLDSIVVHELCHIDELNHSAAFWGLLDERYPRHREATQWLRAHGAGLRISPPTTMTSAPSVPVTRSQYLSGTTGWPAAAHTQLDLF